jgi:hypothetical protein
VDWGQAIAPQHAADIVLTEGHFFANRAAHYRQALELLVQARKKVLPGSRDELDYVILKTETFIKYLECLSECCEATITLDRLWLALVNKNWVDFGVQLSKCQAILSRANRLAQRIAGQMIAYADIPTEKHLLLRLNRNVIVPTENGPTFIDRVLEYYHEKQRTDP